jgi:transcription elongation factor/antiterminator RfaH
MTSAAVQGARFWYALHVKSNQEQNTRLFLEDRSVECFLPCYERLALRRGKRLTLRRPLFSGYLFVHIDLHAPERIEILRAPGTVRIVGFGDSPTPVPDEVIESIRILVGGASGEALPHPLIREGQKVRVVEGPFCGAVGVLHREPGRKARLVVEVEFLGRAVAVPIEPRQVVPISIE